MSRKQYSRAARVALVVVVAAIAVLLPGSVPGETVRLKDGSTLKGRLVRVDGDTLTIKLSIGAPIKVLRNQVESIAFSDSIVPPPAGGALAQPVKATAAPVTGVGTVSIKFEDRKVSTKITINKKKNWDEKVRSNAILVQLIVDGVVAYTAADTTMDKTIYLGEEKQLKNDAELADFDVKVPAGRHLCSLVIKNRDPDTFRESFDPAPLSAVLDFGTLDVAPGGVMRLDIKIDKGLLRMSSPRLYRANTGEDN